MQTHTRARACADADVRRCTRARVGGRRCRHRRETRARAQRTRARTRGRKPRCMRATQMQTQPRARAEADADALTRRCRRRFGRTCIDRDGVRFRGFRYWVGVTNCLEAETEHAKYSNHLESYRDSPRSMRLTRLLTTQSGEKTSSSNGSGVQLGGRHGIGIIFNGGLAVFKRARRFAIGCLCGSRILATLRIPPPCHWQHREPCPRNTSIAKTTSVGDWGLRRVFRTDASMHRYTARAYTPRHRYIECRALTDKPKHRLPRSHRYTDLDWHNSKTM